MANLHDPRMHYHWDIYPERFVVEKTGTIARPPGRVESLGALRTNKTKPSSSTCKQPLNRSLISKREGRQANGT